MIFSSTVFLFLFFPAVVIAYYLRQNRMYRNAILLLFSIAFYAWGEPCFVWVMLGSVVINWFIVKKMDQLVGKWRTLVCVMLVTLDLGLLFIFKYVSFVAENVCHIYPQINISIDIKLPIGISFFVFQILSYVFDVYYRTCRAQKSVWKTMLYVCLFPQLIAGPIVRYETVERELENRAESLEDFSRGCLRFIYGLGKKVLIADHLAYLADPVFTGAFPASVGTAWLAAILYTLQIYYDFSGYSDMAIGLGMIFGFHFPENFNDPYIAGSVTEFWRRWHISLGSWFRDYVYIPLGGNRVKKGRWVCNLLIVWALTGIWHGANWTFVVWGLYYFTLLIIEKCLLGRRLKVHPIIGHVYTLLAVTVGWVIFRCDSVAHVGRYLLVMAGVGRVSGYDASTFLMLRQGVIFCIVALIGATPLPRLVYRRFGERGKTICIIGSSAAVLVLSVVCCMKATYSPFIYFNF